DAGGGGDCLNRHPVLGKLLDDAAPLALRKTGDAALELSGAVGVPRRVAQLLPVLGCVGVEEEVPDGGEAVPDLLGAVLGGGGHVGAHQLPPRCVADFCSAIQARTSASS